VAARSKIQRIRVIRDTVVMNRVVMAGEVLDASQGLESRDAELLIHLGKAVEIERVPQEQPKPAKAKHKKPPDEHPAAGGLTTETAAAIVSGKRMPDAVKE
jgi:hypothetical protein